MLALDEISDALPDRQYVGSRSRGVDLMIMRGRVATVQIYVKAMQGFSSYAGGLPFGITMEMNQDEVHGLLGVPVRYDKSYSSYRNAEGRTFDLPINDAALAAAVFERLKGLGVQVVKLG
ncbi:hypothetical protein [Ralstonia pseudosolanacearum]